MTKAQYQDRGHRGGCGHSRTFFYLKLFAWLMRVTSLNNFASIPVHAYAPKSTFAFLGQWPCPAGTYLGFNTRGLVVFS